MHSLIKNLYKQIIQLTEFHQKNFMNIVVTQLMNMLMRILLYIIDLTILIDQYHWDLIRIN